MRSRSSAAAGLVACGLSMTVGAYASDPSELPRADCTKRVVDAEGDTKISGTAVTAPGLDIVSVFFGTTPEEVLIFLKLKDIPVPSSMPQTDPAYRYTVSFKHGPTQFSFKHLQVNPQYNNALLPSLYTGKYPETTPVGTAATGGVNPATDLVSFRVPRASMEAKSGGLPVTDGGEFTAISAVATWFGSVEAASFTVDDAKPTGDAAKYTVGDNYCIGPLPATVTEVSATPAQFGDVSTLSAKLLNDKGEPLANEQLTFTVAGSPRAPLTATTDAAGVATVPYTVDAPAGTQVVTVAFAGTATAGKASAPVDLLVKTEVTKFLPLAVKKTSATARTVTATLRDDDGKAMAKQKVGWYVNNKLVKTLTTDASGRSVYKGVKAKQVVQARYVGVAGKYAAAKSNAPRV